MLLFLSNLIKSVDNKFDWETLDVMLELQDQKICWFLEYLLLIESIKCMIPKTDRYF